MSRKLRGFQLNNLGSSFIDNLNDSSIHTNWTTDDPLGGSTIIEYGAGSGLRISNPGGATIDWIEDTGTYQAPNVNTLLQPYDFTAKVYISGITQVQKNAGSLVHYKDGSKNKYHSVGIMGSDADDFVSTHATSIGLSSTGYAEIMGGDGWIVLMRRGNYIHCLYSGNDSANEPEIKDMFVAADYVAAFDYNKGRIALVAESGPMGWPAISVEFRKFSLTYTI